MSDQEQEVFIKQFLNRLKNRKGSSLTSSEEEAARKSAEKAWNFSIRNQELLDGD